MSDSPELLKPNTEVTEVTEVTDTGSQIELGNLQAENENLRRQLENSDRLVCTTKEQVQKLRSQLATAEQNASEWQEENSDLATKLKEQREEIERLKSKIQNLESELASRPGENSNNSAPIAISEFPESGDLLNRVKKRLPKSKMDMRDANMVVEILEEA